MDNQSPLISDEEFESIERYVNDLGTSPNSAQVPIETLRRVIIFARYWHDRAAAYPDALREMQSSEVRSDRDAG